MAALLKALGVAADKTEIAKEEMRQKGVCMPKYITIGYGDQIGYDRTAPAIRDAAADMAGLDFTAVRPLFAFGLTALPQSTETAEEVAVRKPIILFAIGAFALPANAMAQSPELEDTCKSVAKSFFMTDQLTIGTVQSFPELKPPGVRMSYSTRQGTPPAEMTDIFECEFDKADKPHNLARFCVSSTCYSPNGDDGDRKRRFDEMRILLNRAEK